LTVRNRLGAVWCGCCSSFVTDSGAASVMGTCAKAWQAAAVSCLCENNSVLCACVCVGVSCRCAVPRADCP
jgi:hypothetical protein